MERDQQGQANRKYRDWDEEVTVGEDGAEFFDFSHRGFGPSGWRNHKEACAGLSTAGHHEDH